MNTLTRIQPFVRRVDDFKNVYFIPADMYQVFDELLESGEREQIDLLFNQYKFNKSEDMLTLWIDTDDLK